MVAPPSQAFSGAERRAPVDYPVVASDRPMNGGQIAGDAPRCHGWGSSAGAGRWTGPAAFVALLVLMLGAALPSTARASHEPGRPNILLILTDDQRAEGTM